MFQPIFSNPLGRLWNQNKSLIHRFKLFLFCCRFQFLGNYFAQKYPVVVKGSGLHNRIYF